jgi:hypothetical protein
MRPGRRDFRLSVAAMLVAFAVAGCSSFGGSKSDQPRPAADPNAYPADYRNQIVVFLRQSLTDRADFRGALIAAPALKQTGDSQRYMVCVQVNGRGQPKTKVAIYFGGLMTQFIDATDQCTGAAYLPFRELEAAIPPQ